jgi:crotonobetainyl-CoA:carnitine CoA-transferase CaiB-like acyl-CoA transferase
MAGIRILEVAEHTFVPAASAVLAEWGAEVIKVEHAERGDAMRGLARTGVLPLKGGVHVILEHSNRGKKSIGLDLSQPEGLKILYDLAKISDVFLTNKNPGVRTRLKIDVDDIRAVNPDIIYVRGSGYGPKGPDADLGGYDFLAFHCRSGNAAASKAFEVDTMPPPPAPAYGDSIGAMTIAGGISAALLHRERTGEATVVDVSLLATGMWAMSAAIALSMQLEVPWKQGPANRDNVRNPLTGTYQTKDGRWLAFSCLQYFHYWPDACDLIGHPELKTDPRFDTFEHLTDNAPAAAEILATEFASRPFDEWIERLRSFRGQWAPVQDTLEIQHDPQVEANGYLMEATSKEGAPFRLVTSPVQFNEEPTPPQRGPDFNEHGDEILSEQLGLDWDTIVDLKVKGVVA